EARVPDGAVDHDQVERGLVRRLAPVRQAHQRTALSGRTRLNARGGAPAPPHLSGELARVGDGSAAGETLADVDGRPAVDARLALEQRDVVRGPEGDDRVGIEAAQGGAGDLRLPAAENRELARR